ncbi:MAG: DUF5916 domain-containing protein [Vicinamibacterales bacterium]
MSVYCVDMPRRRAVLLATLCLAAAPAASAQPTPPVHPPVVAARAARPPVIDGVLDDEEWTRSFPAGGFIQRDPDEGRPATSDTQIRVLYDDAALYVAARMLDPEPERITRRLSPRDAEFDADWIGLYLDPMRDRLTGAVFRVSAGNVQWDEQIFNDTATESSWDAVWQSAVTVDADGWNAELRIPLSQLRFTSAIEQTWGINVERYVQRKNENSFLEMVPKNESGLASRMVALEGLSGLSPRRRLELLPYLASRAEFITADEGNPFNDGTRAFAAGGLDAKVGITSNLTLNATINPDFGQVEVDPAVVNLSQFETFFEEKRPFFVEGAQIFSNFGFGGSNSFWGFNSTDPTIFYSRRIGRAPQLDADGDFTDAPAATTILGAAKVTGKTSGGWSLGFLEAVTGNERARVQEGLGRSEVLVEPLTNYMVARMQREAGRFGAGFLATAVNRQLPDVRFSDKLASGAYVFGADAYVFLDRGRQWVITGKIAGSHVAGSDAAMTRIQRASQRYFQRPDAPHVELDESRRSLRGYTTRVVLNRNSGRWLVNAQYFGTTPGYESNDLGFHNNADRQGAHGVFLWRETTPRGIFRFWNGWVSKWFTWNYARELQANGLNSNSFMIFRNYWELSVGGGRRWRTLDDRLTRGGPIATNPAGGFFGIGGSTDRRRRLSLQPRYDYNANEFGGWNSTINLSLTAKPSPRWTISTGPQWSRTHNVAQYVDSVDDASATDTYGRRYVFGELEQSQLTMTTRVSMTLTPTLGVQVFAQPLIAAGDYTNFKSLAAPRTFTFSPQPGVLTEFDLDDPDFNRRSLRVNAVLRWEMKPGSTLYAVWTRFQEDEAVTGPYAFGRDARALLRSDGDDVFLVKIAYWIGR